MWNQTTDFFSWLADMTELALEGTRTLVVFPLLAVHKMCSVEGIHYGMQTVCTILTRIDCSLYVFIGTAIVFAVTLLLRAYEKSHPQLSQAKLKQLSIKLAGFNPAPLEEEIKISRDISYALKPKQISGIVGTEIILDGRKMLNLATHNYLSLSNRMATIAKAKEAVNQYGVGAGGPRALLGTFDIHLELERKLAEFMRTETASLYGQNFATTYSVIPAYLKPDDVVFADECVHFALQESIRAAACETHFFKHNDLEDLRCLLNQQEQLDRKSGRIGKTKWFIVIEGIYMNNGQVANLPGIVKLRAEHKCRLMVDESISFGTLGDNGRGIFEHFNISLDEVDLHTGSLEHALSCFGGFICGTKFIVEHQEAHSPAHSYSSSLPPLQTAAALENLKCLIAEPHRVRNLQAICQEVHRRLLVVDNLRIVSDNLSPIKYLMFVRPAPFGQGNLRVAIDAMDSVVEMAADRGIALTLARQLNEREENIFDAAIRLTVNCELKPDQIDYLVETIKDVSRLIPTSVASVSVKPARFEYC